MAFSVSDFSSQLNSRDTAKQSHFTVRLFFPNELNTINAMNVAGRELQFRIDSAEVPGRSLQTLQTKPYGGGLTHKIPYDVTYPDVTITVICGGDLAEKAVFQDWQNLAIGKHSTTGNYRNHDRIGYYDTFARNQVEILQYNQDGKPSSMTTLHQAYPLTVNSLPLTWAGEDIHRVTIQFAYLFYEYRSLINSSNALGTLKNVGTSILGNVIGDAVGGETGNLIKQVANGNLSPKQAVGIAAGGAALKTLGMAVGTGKPSFTNDLGISIQTGAKNPFEVALDINPTQYGASPASIITGPNYGVSLGGQSGSSGFTGSVSSSFGGGSVQASASFGSGGFSGSSSFSI